MTPANRSFTYTGIEKYNYTCSYKCKGKGKHTDTHVCMCCVGVFVCVCVYICGVCLRVEQQNILIFHELLLNSIHRQFGTIPVLISQLCNPDTKVQIAVLVALRNLSYGEANEENKLQIMSRVPEVSMCVMCVCVCVCAYVHTCVCNCVHTHTHNTHTHPTRRYTLHMHTHIYRYVNSLHVVWN